MPLGQRPYSIRTRIKTLRDSICRNIGFISQRPYSIRTRIKTNSGDLTTMVVLGQRPYSIRTRIKTFNRLNKGGRTKMSETIFH